MIAPFRYTHIFCRAETIGVVSGNCHFHCDSGPLCSTSDKCQSEHGPHSGGCPSSRVPGAQLSLCALCTVVESEQQLSKRCLHSETNMGQWQTRPTPVLPAGALPQSPRTVCAFRLGEPPHRFCCPYQYQHFSYPERTMSYSPPYSPSLFKRPDRR